MRIAFYEPNTFTTNCYYKGVNVKVLGHADVNVTCEGYDEEVIRVTWSLEGNVITLYTDVEGLKTMQGAFHGSSIDFSDSVSDLYFYLD